MEEAEELWQQRPFLILYRESTCAIRESMLEKDSRRRSVAQTKSAYKIMKLVGRFAAGDQWTEACALVCYRASEEVRSKLFSEQYNILDELHQRITHTHTGNILEELYERSEDELLQDVMSFWGRLNDYRERNYSCLLQSCEDEFVTPKQVSCILENFKYHELWYDPTWRQGRSKRWRSTLNAILHKRSGWAHAARAIMEYGLPKLEQPAKSPDATEHVNAI